MTETINVKGMSCKHCQGSVKGIISEIDGVKHVEVSLEHGTAKVDFEPEQVKLESIINQINQSHYQASAV